MWLLSHTLCLLTKHTDILDTHIYSENPSYRQMHCCSKPTWLCMYLVCSPCSSEPSPSISILYLGLMIMIINTDFCNTALLINNGHSERVLWQIGFKERGASYKLTSFKKLSIHLFMSSRLTGSSNISIYGKTHKKKKTKRGLTWKNLRWIAI